VTTLDQTLAALRAAAALKAGNKAAFFVPYARQIEFCTLGATHRERLLMAANQVGKSEIGAVETTAHLTGVYPHWWQGKRFKFPTKGWAAGETGLVVRDVQQLKLCGQPGVDSMFGTGLIPKDLLLGRSMARGVSDAYDTIQVRHVPTGGVSTLSFKSYEQGRTKFQGTTLDFGWCDEEPDWDIYDEFLTRLREGGIMFMTFTPLKGRSKVVLRFMDKNDEGAADRIIIGLTLAEVTHFSDEEKKKRVAGYAAHLREAREKGIPVLGEGLVYLFPDSMIREEAIEYVPTFWRKLWGIDVGIGHPFAAVLGLHDADADCLHIHATYKKADQLPLFHARAMMQIGANVPVAWPHDAHQRQQGSDTAEELAAVYKRHGLKMLPDHAQFASGGYSREAAVSEIIERSLDNRFKVAGHLVDWWMEKGLYHRKEGVIVRAEDDLMSATEKIIMDLRHAKPVALGSVVAQKRQQTRAQGTEETYWGID
jgi:phage terminase large subunit-like protein